MTDGISGVCQAGSHSQISSSCMVSAWVPCQRAMSVLVVPRSMAQGVCILQASSLQKLCDYYTYTCAVPVRNVGFRTFGPCLGSVTALIISEGIMKIPADQPAMQKRRRRRWVTALLLASGIYVGMAAAIAWNTIRPKRSR